jgi:hypothetical protein
MEGRDWPYLCDNPASTQLVYPVLRINGINMSTIIKMISRCFAVQAPYLFRSKITKQIKTNLQQSYEKTARFECKKILYGQVSHRTC